jgi:hypothetical protein
MSIKISDIDNARLLKSFPSYLKQDVEEVIEVLPSDGTVLIKNGEVHKIDSLIHPTEYTVTLHGEQLTIPYRNYFNELALDKENALTAQQKTILNCIYLRHHNGFVRQKRLELLVDSGQYFVIPYTLHLLGEYVVEILEVLDRHINDSTLDNYTKFISENEKYWRQTQSRMISYWNEYYRRPTCQRFSKPTYPILRLYIGQQIADKLERRTHNTGLLQPGPKLQ